MGDLYHVACRSKRNLGISLVRHTGSIGVRNDSKYGRAAGLLVCSLSIEKFPRKVGECLRFPVDMASH